MSRTTDRPLSHDMTCPRCGHALHTYLPCGDACPCPPIRLPGVSAEVNDCYAS